MEKYPVKISQDDIKSLDELLQQAARGDMAPGLASIAGAASEFVVNQTKRMMGTLVEYKELMMMYTCAMKEIRTKFEVLNTEFNIRYQRNPISSITTRLKRTSSISEKMERNGWEFSPESIEKNLNDVAGVRVICSYIDDIYTIADALLQQDDITLIARKDYIAEPKPNGYRSLHLIVSVPVFFYNQKREMKVEVQIRTIAMDFWASLEHQLKYKQEVPDQREIVQQLKECADRIAATDQEMLKIRNRIEETADALTEEDILFEKMGRLDMPIE